MKSLEDEAARAQLSGVLSKRPVILANHNASLLEKKWSRRFFVVKDGFLFYYPENEKREYEKRRTVNYHPKGLMCLSDCVINKIEDGDYKYLISIRNDMSQETLVVSCETSWEQEEWYKVLQLSTRVTYKNLVVSDDIITQLEEQGSKLAKEKQIMYERFHSEVAAHSMEKTKNEEMLQVMEEMEKEKINIEKTFNELQGAFSEIRCELDRTTDSVRMCELEKTELSQKQSKLNMSLQELEEARLAVENQLRESEGKSKQLELENTQLSDLNDSTHTELSKKIDTEIYTKNQLEGQLEDIQTQLDDLQEDKQQAELRVREQQMLAEHLEEEKKLYQDEARKLERDLSEIKHQKDLTETELKHQIEARLEAERRLKEAEQALGMIEEKVNNSVQDSFEEKEQMLRNVKTLRRYFEKRAVEEKLSADKVLLMKKSIEIKRRQIRAKSSSLTELTFSTTKRDSNKRSSEIL